MLVPKSGLPASPSKSVSASLAAGLCNGLSFALLRLGWFVSTAGNQRELANVIETLFWEPRKRGFPEAWEKNVFQAGSMSFKLQSEVR